MFTGCLGGGRSQAQSARQKADIAAQAGCRL